MPTTVIIKQGEGREVNPYSGNRSLEENEMRKDFNRDHPAYSAPGIADGTWECELVWQERQWGYDWENVSEPTGITVYTRQIWVLAESKEGEKRAHKTLDEIVIKDYPHVLIEIISDLFYNSGRLGEEWLKDADPLRKQEVLEEYIKQKIYEQQF